MKPRIKIAEQNFESRKNESQKSDSEEQQIQKAIKTKKIHKEKKDKKDKKQKTSSNKYNKQSNIQLNSENQQQSSINLRKFKHLAICVPDSLVSIPQSSVLRAYFVSQLARICAIFRVDEIIVLHDFSYKSKSDLFSPAEYMVRNLQYLETPQYLRKYLFEIHPDLKNAGIMNPIEADHHLKEPDICSYRQGVVIDRPMKANCGSWVDIGLRVHAKINYVLPPKTRVTVKLQQPQKQQKFFNGEAVSKKDAQQQLGLYWGYSVRVAHNIKSVFKGEQPYTKTILIDSKIKDKSKQPKLEQSLPQISSNDSVLLLFAGYDGLQAMIDNDQGCKVSLKEIISEVQSIHAFQKSGVKQLRIQQMLFLMLNKITNN